MCKKNPNNPIVPAFPAHLLATLICAAFFVAWNLQAQICQPQGCTSTSPLGSATHVTPGGDNFHPTAHIGDTLQYKITFTRNLPDCPLTNVDVFLMTADSNVVQILSNATICLGDTFTCPGTDPRCLHGTSPVTYTIRPQDIGKRIELDVPNKGNAGGTVNPCLNQPAPTDVAAVFNAVGITVGAQGIQSFSSCINLSATVLRPCITCTKTCTPSTTPTGTINFQGTVVNCAANPTEQLINVSVSNLVNGVLTLVTNIPVLPAGSSASYSGGYPGSCLPTTDTIFVSGANSSDMGVLVTNSSCFATCTNPCAPAIKVFKQVVCYTPAGCDAFNADLTTQKRATAVSFGSDCPAFCYRITVTNVGTVTLSNVTLTDLSVPGPNILPSSSCVLPAPFNLAPAGQPGSGFQCTIPAITRCANDTNIVTAQAVGQVTGGGTQTVTDTDTNRVTVIPINIACVLEVSTNNGATFTDSYHLSQGNCPRFVAGTTYIIRAQVINNGQFPLQNVGITNTGGPCFTTPIVVGNLAVGQTNFVNLCTNTCSGNVTNNYSVAVGGEASTQGTNICTFTAQGKPITASSACDTCVVCFGCPRLCVTKSVTCVICGGTPTCGTFGHEAFGVRTSDDLPGFCYLITVTNCGEIALANVLIQDDHFGVLATVNLAVNEGRSFNLRTNWSGVAPAFPQLYSVTNTVTASACCYDPTCPGVSANGTVSASANAIVHVRPASIDCRKLVTLVADGVTVCDAVAACNATNCSAQSNYVFWQVWVTNTGQADLTNIVVQDESGQGIPGCSIAFRLDGILAPGQVAGPYFVCTNSFGCADTNIVNHVHVSAEAASEGTNCVCTINGLPVSTDSSCQASLHTCCVTPTFGCRVTGGGRQDLLTNPRPGQDGITEVCPPDSRYVTHGGQVGAPVGNAITNCPNELGCTNVLFQPLLVNNPIGNVCIHGRWTHVRHTKGGLEGNFHARFYDTLDCSCLSTQFDSCGRYVLGDNTSVPNRCNPGDRIAGPEPRKAPANKIVFTGVGDWADPNGRRTPRSVLFRVDIEDRSEPGGYHPGGAKPPADRYRIRIWVLTPTECQELAGAGPDPGLLHFRSAIAACYGINLRDGVEAQFLANRCQSGSMFFGGCGDAAGCMVRNPDIDDGGELEHGNHQIHPQIKDCDPNNPQAPRLANSAIDCSNF